MRPFYTVNYFVIVEASFGNYDNAHHTNRKRQQIKTSIELPAPKRNLRKNYTVPDFTKALCKGNNLFK